MVEKRVSVAVTTYQGEQFLREQLKSILQQLTKEDEVVISDDGSTDGTIALIQEVQKAYPHISVRLLEGPRQGIKKNVENVLSQSKGQFIFLADQDDIWMSHKVEKVLQCFREQKVSLVIHDAVVFSEDIHVPLMESFFSFRQAKAGVVKNIWKNSYIGCCMAFRRELLKRALPIPGDIEMHDQWLGVLNDIYFKDSYFYREPLLFYRRHGENNSAMSHYGVGRMVRNRLLFLWRLLGRLLHGGKMGN